jgi:hypothetical protein
MVEMIIALADKYPTVASILMVMGVLRAIFKPLMSLIEAYVLATPSTKDDEFYNKMLDSKIYKGIVWVLDYMASVKLPKKKK